MLFGHDVSSSSSTYEHQTKLCWCWLWIFTGLWTHIQQHTVKQIHLLFSACIVEPSSLNSRHCSEIRSGESFSVAENKSRNCYIYKWHKCVFLHCGVLKQRHHFYPPFHSLEAAALNTSFFLFLGCVCCVCAAAASREVAGPCVPSIASCSLSQLRCGI